MKKRMMLILAAIFCSTLGLFAQLSQMATLTHGTTTTSYYGETAFSQAYNSAVNGDVITLTGGNFAAITIEKAITVRGNGVKNDANNGTLKTVIEGLTINYPSNANNIIKIESVEISNLSIAGNSEKDHILILKSVIGAVSFGKCTANFLQSYIGYLNYIGNGNSCNIYVSNCLTGSLHSQYGSKASVFEMEHCNIRGEIGIDNVAYKNSIILCTNGSYLIRGNSTCSYCVGAYIYDSNKNIFDVLSDYSTCTNVGDCLTTIFEDGSSYGATCDYRLSETAASTYLGDDGTQVGAYGGDTPFDLTPTNPRIKKFSVSTTNNNNTLNVRLNVQ